jgi:hypothetical protein
METTVFATKDFRVVAADLADAKEKLRGYIGTREFWLLVFDGAGMPIVEEITRRYYWTSESPDMFVCLCPTPGGYLGVGVFRRRLMLAPKFKFLLDKHGVCLSSREIVESGAIFRALPRNVRHVERLAKSLGLRLAGADLAMGA